MILICSLLLCSLVYQACSEDVLETLEWGSTNQNVRLFYEDSGEIKQKSRSPTGVWTQGVFNYPGYSISGITYVEDGRKYRAYVGNKHFIQEYINNGSGWSLGDLKVPGEVSNASFYIDTAGKVHIRLYVIDKDGKVKEYNYNPGTDEIDMDGEIDLDNLDMDDEVDFGWDEGKYLFTVPVTGEVKHN